MIVAGDLKRGVPLVEDAMPFAVHPPVWNYTAFAFANLQMGHYEEALQWALKVDAPNWFVAPMTVCRERGAGGSARNRRP